MIRGFSTCQLISKKILSEITEGNDRQNVDRKGESSSNVFTDSFHGAIYRQRDCKGTEFHPSLGNSSLTRTNFHTRTKNSVIQLEDDVSMSYVDCTTVSLFARAALAFSLKFATPWEELRLCGDKHIFEIFKLAVPNLWLRENNVSGGHLKKKRKKELK